MELVSYWMLPQPAVLSSQQCLLCSLQVCMFMCASQCFKPSHHSLQLKFNCLAKSDRRCLHLQLQHLWFCGNTLQAITDASEGRIQGINQIRSLQLVHAMQGLRQLLTVVPTLRPARP